MKHGTRAAIAAGCVCDGCGLMARLYERGTSVFPQHRGRASSSVPADPFRVVLAAALERGQTVSTVAAFCDVDPSVLYRLRRSEGDCVGSSVAERLRRMTLLLPSEVAS